ncbi:MAG: NTP transferase domain-containing protein, partial [Muribaculaceae bacterium]|nr:NTP transferase domain-containing protein [Muribaculaceae bacterium]
MKVLILAAGVGSRLRPLTDTMPKALVPVCGVPMLQHVILRLKGFGFDDLVINVHHFANQIIDFLNTNDNFGVKIAISHEEDELLDTGGAILHAASLLGDNEPVLVHNVDILSNC